MSTLVVAAHPDDEILGCGATIARLAQRGEAVHILILGEGSTSRADARDLADHTVVDELAAMAESAGSTVGARSVRLAGLPDNRFDSVDLLDIVKLIEGEIAAVGPTTVFTHHGADLNVDHRRTHDAVLAATRPLPGTTIAEVLTFEVLSSSEWSFGSHGDFRPNVYVDVSDTLATKQAALQVYAGEMRDFPHPRSHEAVDALARLRGSTIAVAAAEAFQLVRSVR